MDGNAIIVGPPDLCRRVEQQLDLVDHRPVILGWVVCDPRDIDRPGGGRILGAVADLDAILRRHRPGTGIVSLPAAMQGLVESVRTRLRRAGVPDRFFPTIEDQLAGIGPRTHVEVDTAALLNRPPRTTDASLIGRLISGRRVLITGAGGSIGSELARQTAPFEPDSITLVDRSENALFEIDRQIARTHPNLVRRAALHDIVRERETMQLVREIAPDIIFHAAAHKHVPMMEDHPAEAIDNNFFGTYSIANAADRAGVDRFVMISTDKAVNPRSVMGGTKRLAEMAVQELHGRSTTAFAMVRFGNVLGSSGSVLDVWSRQIAEGGPLTITDARMTRYFMTIPEAAALVIQAAAMSRRDDAADVYVLDMGEPVSILDLAARFANQYGFELEHGTGIAIGGAVSPRAGRIGLVTIGARPGEKIHEELARHHESLEPTVHPDIQRLRLEAPTADTMASIIDRLQPEHRPTDQRSLGTAVAECLPEMSPELALSTI